MSSSENLYIIHPGTGTVMAASECRTVRLTPEQAGAYADGLGPALSALADRLADPVDDPREAAWFDPEAIRQHFDMHDPQRESGPGADGLDDEELRAAGQLALQSERLWALYHELLDDAVAAVRAGKAEPR